MITAATGFIISSDGVVQNPVPGKSVDNFISELATERQLGRLQGEVTPDYLTGLFSKYSQDPDAALNPAYLDAALSFIDARDHRRAEDTAPRSSFNLGL